MINNFKILTGGKYFGENGSLRYLVCQPFSRFFTSKMVKLVYGSLRKCLKKVLHIHLQQFDPQIIYNYGKGKIFPRNLLKTSVYLILGNAVNLYISHKLSTWSRD